MNPATVLNPGRPFTYLHATHLAEAELERIIAHGTSIELDLATDEHGQPYIGHSLAWYAFRKLTWVESLPVQRIIDRLASTRLYVVIDCKDPTAFQIAKAIVGRLGADRCLMHVSVPELAFKPYEVEEPQWQAEFIPLADVKQVHRRTKVPVIVACRGLTVEKFVQDPSLMSRIADLAEGTAVAINFNIRGATMMPPAQQLDYLLERRILPWVDTDAIPESHRPHRYIGATAHPVHASILESWQ
jgi:hypothetical protein